MKLKHRLSLYSLIIFSVVIVVISAIIYFSFYNTMERKELKSLESKSVLAAIFYLDQDELSSMEHEDIRAQLAKNISRKNIAVYSVDGKQVNGKLTHDINISSVFLSDVQQKKISSFATNDFFYNGIFYKDNQGDFVVVTRESKTEFNDQLNSLLQILTIVSIASLVLIYFFSQFLGYIAYQPINNIINQIKKRNTTNFQEPLQLKKSYAEVDDLIKTYNQFIDQIAQTFSIQKNFIDYVSHELRTPITALIGTLEVTKNKQRTSQEYEQTLLALNQYTNDLQESLDQMMLLSGAKTSFELTMIRIDEIVWKVIENATLYHQAKIDVDFQVQNIHTFNYQGNEKLLELALNNILFNAIKYSDNKLVKITLFEEDGKLQLHIADQGIGILEDDLEHIKQNFFRGQNTKQYQGKGIGLSMAHIIFKLHQIDLQIVPNKPVGTLVKLKFKHF
ncbi:MULTISPECIES: sensor histidine kinase KdpD [unclassified Flavobacterium]|uniref:sensor histidine kinase n=1 Tax=unclassified Flavobacterium TaxID=196869 RepID=UPI001F09FF19|nr:MULTISPECIES: HAMP domain-containing sensor histidine kinase [unclassified Flavobacterium]